MALNSAEVNSGQSDESSRRSLHIHKQTRRGPLLEKQAGLAVRTFLFHPPPPLTTLSRDNVLFMLCALSSDSPFHIIPPRLPESGDRLGHVTVIIFLSGDKDMDCRGSALILHAPLPTSTLCLFSTEAPPPQKKRKRSACIAVGAALHCVCQRRFDFFIHQLGQTFKKIIKDLPSFPPLIFMVPNVEGSLFAGFQKISPRQPVRAI